MKETRVAVVEEKVRKEGEGRREVCVVRVLLCCRGLQARYWINWQLCTRLVENKCCF
jgi:hypothetical protein